MAARRVALAGAAGAAAVAAAGTCQAGLRALDGCTMRLAAHTACATPELLNGTLVRQALQCGNASLAECHALCLATAGRLFNGSDEECTVQQQLMKEYSGTPTLVVSFVPDPKTGLPRPMPLPSTFASGGLPSFSYFGDYQRCLYSDDMQYCLLEGSLQAGPLKTGALMGLCRPASCSSDDVKDHTLKSSSQLKLQGTKVTCRRNGEPSPPIAWTPGRTAALVLFLAIAAMLLAASAHHALRDARATRGAGGVGQALLAAWSVPRNLQSFSRLRKVGTGPDMSALDGLRVVSTFWVILGHVVIWPLLSIQYENAGVILPPHGRLAETWFQIVPGGYFAVDTFFWLSGFLGAKALHSKVRRSRSLLSPKGFCLRLFPMTMFMRWLRLTPVYAFVLLFANTWYREIGRGGLLWNATTGMSGGMGCVSSVDSDSCKKYWWAQLLYINNIYPRSEGQGGCMSWSWYLACDMQLFLLLPFIVLIRERGGKAAGWAVVAALTAACIVANYAVIKSEKLLTDPVLGALGGNRNGGPSFMRDVYEVAWMRAQPYLIGIASAWVLEALLPARSAAAGAPPLLEAAADQEIGSGAAPTPLLAADASAAPPTRPQALAARTAVAVALQLLSFAAMSFVVFYPVTRYQCSTLQACLSMDTNPWSETGNALYGALNHAVWGLGLATLMVLCFLRAPGTGWINCLLGAGMWQAPAKLTYSAYLLHPLIIVCFLCLRDRSLQFFETTLISNFIAFASTTFFVAFIVWVCVEKPLANLTAVLMGALAGQKAGAEE